MNLRGSIIYVHGYNKTSNKIDPFYFFKKKKWIPIEESLQIGIKELEKLTASEKANNRLLTPVLYYKRYFETVFYSEIIY